MSDPALKSATLTASTLSHILVVEDEIAIADALLYALRGAGFAPSHAVTLAQARHMIGAQTPDLLILDLSLPDGSGLDLCREIRRSAAPAGELPILMLTAMSDEVDRIVGLELGADDYVSKPFSPREVCLRVKTILRRTQSAEPTRPDNNAALARSQLASTAFEIDIQGQRIRYAAQWLDLTRRELHVLQLLLQRPGHIFSRETLLDRVWGRDAESMERTVDTHIKTLRAKLRSANPERDVIVTHRGLGYSLSID